MTTKKITTILAAFLLTTGIALAQPADIPEPGLTPDSPFYGLEKASERLELAVAQAPVIGSEELEAKVRANHAAETLAEARAMADKNNTQQVEKLMNRYSENMNKSIKSAASTNQSELKERLRNITNNQNQALEELDNKVPEQAKKGIQKAMENNRKNQEKLGRPAQNPATPDQGNSKTPEQEPNKPSGETSSSPITGRSTTPENPVNTEPQKDSPSKEKSSAQEDTENSSNEEGSDSSSKTSGKEQQETVEEPSRDGRP